MTGRLGKKWTMEEMDYLEQMWGRHSVDMIADRLSRSYQSVKQKACKMGLGSALESTELVLIRSITDAMGLQHNIVRKWLDNGLPHKKRVLHKRTYYMVQMPLFWAWAQIHLSMVDFSRTEYGDLGDEPPWVEDARRNAQRRHMMEQKRPWTEREDKTLRRLSDQGETDDEIGRQLGRTAMAVGTRRRRIGIGHQSRRNHDEWTPTETDMLVEMIREDQCMTDITAALGRSAQAVQSKLQKTFGTCRRDEVRRQYGRYQIEGVGVCAEQSKKKPEMEGEPT